MESSVRAEIAAGSTAPLLALSDADLDEFRSRGDAVLDPLVDALPAGAIGDMLGVLFRSTRIPEEDPRFAALLGALPVVALEGPELIEAGQELFQLYGPEVLIVLGCYGLPAAYAAANGAQVIHRARRFEDDAKRRLCETAQMLINVMIPGGLAPGGIGARSALKVRLMHALVRRSVRIRTDRPWSPEFGEPINQEDLAGTLLTFSVLVLDGLDKMGAELSERETRGYLWAWRHIGLMLGIDPRLIATSLREAAALAARIGRRQIKPSAEGRKLARDLVDVTDSMFPVSGYGASLMRFFLDDVVLGVNLAEVLDLPPPNWTRVLVRARAKQKRFVLHWLNRVSGGRIRRRAFSRYFTQKLILMQNPDKQAPFEVPAESLDRWCLRG